MPKRKKDDNFDSIQRKIRRLEKKLRRKRRRNRHRYRSDESESYSSDSSNSSSMDKQDMPGCEEGEGYDMFFNEDDLTASSQRNEESHTEKTISIPPDAIPVTTPPDPKPAEPSATGTTSPEEAAPATESLDSDVLEILGIDPTSDKKYGRSIHKDLSVRLQHWATTGLSKELRKEYKEKYLTPENCKLIDPPELNPEIKAAVSEIVAKRDKAIEGKQKELTLAITCLGEAITQLLSSKEKNNDLLKLLMNSARIVCDCQHADTVTRRNFLLSSVKKEMREQLQSTKVDKLLFGENLAETLKSAKAINKSGTDLKPPAAKNLNKKPSSSSQRNLNWRAPGPSRKPTMGPLRTKEQAPPSTHRRPSSSSKQSQPPPQRQSYNRR